MRVSSVLYGLTTSLFSGSLGRDLHDGRENGVGPHDLLANAVGHDSAHELTHRVKKPGGWKNLGTFNRFQQEEFGRCSKLKDTPEPAMVLCWTILLPCTVQLPVVSPVCNYPIISAGGNFGFNNGFIPLVP